MDLVSNKFHIHNSTFLYKSDSKCSISNQHVTILLVDECPREYPCANGDRCCTKTQNSYGTTMNCGETCPTPSYGKYCRDHSEYTLK